VPGSAAGSGRSGGRIEHPASVPVGGETGQVQACAQHVDASVRDAGDPLEDVAGEVEDVDVRLVVAELGHEERARVRGGVGADEDRIGGEGAPRAADGAEAADLPRRETQQGVEQRVRGEPVGAGGGARSHRPGCRRHRRSPLHSYWPTASDGTSKQTVPWDPNQRADGDGC
jgi:hypothetical protein